MERHRHQPLLCLESVSQSEHRQDDAGKGRESRGCYWLLTVAVLRSVGGEAAGRLAVDGACIQRRFETTSGFRRVAMFRPRCGPSSLPTSGGSGARR